MKFAEQNPRYDLLTGEPIPYKTKDKYLSQFFINRNNMKAWYKQAENKEAFEKTVEMFVTRKNIKKIKYAFTEVELRTSELPTASLLYLMKFNYDDVIEAAGLVKRFEYDKTKLEKLPEKKITVVQDTREQKPLNTWSKNIRILVNKLDFGDYAPEENPCKIYIERKSLSDFIGSMSSKNFDRVCREIERAQKADATLFFVIEHPFSRALSFDYSYAGKFSRATPDYIFSQVRTILQKYPNVQFVFVQDRNYSCRFIEYVFNLGEDAKKYDWQFMINNSKLRQVL